MASVVVAAPPKTVSENNIQFGYPHIEKGSEEHDKNDGSNWKVFYSEHTTTYNLVSLSEEGWGELIQIENKEFSKSRVVAMLSQTRKGKHIIKKKKKKLWNLLHFGSTQRKTKEVKRQHCFARENETARGIERALTGISLSACPACPVLSIADQKNEGESSIKQKKSFTRRSCLS